MNQKKPQRAVPAQDGYKSKTKTWHVLTDDDYQQILKQHNGAGLLAFYNLIEAKLREKNT